MTIQLPECAPGEEAWPTDTGYVCGPADPAIPEDIDQHPEVLPEPLPLDPLPTVTATTAPAPLPEQLAETGHADTVLAALLAIASFAILLGLAILTAHSRVTRHDRNGDPR